MSYKAGNRFKEDTYFLTEVENDGSKAKVTGQLNGEEVDFESGSSGGSGVLKVIFKYDVEYGDAWSNPSYEDIRNAFDNNQYIEVFMLKYNQNNCDVLHLVNVSANQFTFENLGNSETYVLDPNVTYDPDLELPF